MALYALNRAGTLRYTVRDEDGVPAAPAAPPTVSITDAAGTVVGSGTASAGTGTGNYTFALPSAVRTELGLYEATFSFTVGSVSSSTSIPVEIVGDLLFEIEELRDTYPELDDANRYTATMIRSARDEATERLETAAGVSFAQRRTMQTLSGDDTTKLILPHVMVTALHACTIYDDNDGVDLVEEAVTGGDLADVEIYPDAGMLVRTNEYWPRGSRNIVVEYDHGYAQPPAAVRRAAMRLAVEALVPSGMPSRALSQSTDLGEIRFSTANPEAGRPTGDPEVDAVIAIYGRRRPGIG